MGKDIATTQPALLPGLIPNEEAQHLVDDLLRLVGIDDAGREAIARFPTAVERQVMTRRLDELDHCLKSIKFSEDGERQVDKALSMLFGGYPSLLKANANEMVPLYIAWLQDLPAFALIEACRLIGAGKAIIKDPATGEKKSVGVGYVPSHSEIHILAADIANRGWDEVIGINKVLRIKHLMPKEIEMDNRAKALLRVQKMHQQAKRILSDPKISKEQEEAEAARRRELHLIRETANEEMRLQDWEAIGLEPLRVNGKAMTLALAQQLRPAYFVNVKKASA